jgi:hypothetical protein
LALSSISELGFYPLFGIWDLLPQAVSMA